MTGRRIAAPGLPALSFPALGVAALLAGCSSMPASHHGVPPQSAATEPAQPSQLPAPSVQTEPEDIDPTPPCVQIPEPEEPRRHKVKPKAAPAEATAAKAPAGASPEKPPANVAAHVEPVARPVEAILGRKVQSIQGEDLGRVIDVLADGGGQVRAAVIDFGGFLGVGMRRIAVGWPLLRFDPNAPDKPLTLSLSREQLQRVPDYKASAHPRALVEGSK